MPNERFQILMDEMAVFSNANGQVMNDSGKQYTLVKDRIEIFRREFGDEYGITTEVSAPEGYRKGCPVVASCKITSQNGHVVAMGHAIEWIGSDYITASAPVEVAETSAIGRALACLGLSGSEYASANEIERAVAKNRTGVEPPERAEPPRQKELMRVPAEQMTGLYVPDDRQGWSEDEERDEVLKALDQVSSAKELDKYFSEIKPWIETVDRKTNERVMAVFGAVYNTVKGR